MLTRVLMQGLLLTIGLVNLAIAQAPQSIRRFEISTGLSDEILLRHPNNQNCTANGGTLLCDEIVAVAPSAVAPKKSRPILEGAVLGFTVGAVLGGVFANLSHKDRVGGTSRGAAVIFTAMTWAIPGAVVGAAIGSLQRRE